MNKAELIAKVADDAGVTKTQANAALDSFVEAVILDCISDTFFIIRFEQVKDHAIGKATSCDHLGYVFFFHPLQPGIMNTVIYLDRNIIH